MTRLYLDLSLCMIVKNEAENLPRCLASAQPFVDEMIIVDTGSTDQTRAIAQQWGATVIPFEWCDDFAAARNVAIAQATRKWILVLDADEELIVADPDTLCNDLHQNNEILLHLIEIQDVYIQQAPLFLGRLFRNLPEIRYQGRYHEQLLFMDRPFLPHEQQQLTSIAFKHYGFAPDLARDKNLHRNIPFLERLRSEGQLSLMLLTYLIFLYQRTEQLDLAQEALSEAFDRILPNLISGEAPQDRTYIPNLLLILGEQALAQEDYESGQLICRRSCEWYPTFPPLIYLTGMILRDLGFHSGAIAYFETCLQFNRQGNFLVGEPFAPAYMQHLPAHAMGCAYLHLNQLSAAEQSFRLALQFEPHFQEAQAGLDHVLTRLNPTPA